MAGQKDNRIEESIADYVSRCRQGLDIALMEFAKSIVKGLKICCPAVITEYDRKTRRAKVLPLIKYGYLDKDGNRDFKIRQVVNVRVQNMTHGGFSLDFPLFKGDTGWIIASDWNTEILKQKESLTASVLREDRKDQLINEEYSSEPTGTNYNTRNDAIFIPDCWGGFDESRIKDFIGEGGKDLFYLGTAMDTKDKSQSGDKYEKEESCSISFDRKGKLTIAQSTEANKPSKTSIEMSGGATVVQETTEKGNVKITIQDGKVTIETDKDDINVKSGKGVSVSAVTDINLTAPKIYVNGDLAITGNATSNVDFVGGGVSLKSHKHNYTQPQHAGDQGPTTPPV